MGSVNKGPQAVSVLQADTSPCRSLQVPGSSLPHPGHWAVLCAQNLKDTLPWTSLYR